MASQMIIPAAGNLRRSFSSVRLERFPKSGYMFGAGVAAAAVGTAVVLADGPDYKKARQVHSCAVRWSSFRYMLSAH